VHKRALIVLAVSAIVLTLLFVVAAEAQTQTQSQYRNGNAAVAQTETTTANTNNADTASANSLAETTTANNGGGANPNSDNFRCEQFLHVVQGDNGALKNQYRGDQTFEHRFEQCLSGNVLANTIPRRNLPFTGGMSLIALTAIGLISLGLGATVVFRGLMRRGG
jgi:hypothetical protein